MVPRPQDPELPTYIESRFRFPAVPGVFGRNPSEPLHVGRARGWINVRVARDTAKAPGGAPAYSACAYPVSLTDQWGKVPRTPFVVQLMDRTPGSIELNGFRSSFRHRPLIVWKWSVKIPNGFCVGLPG
jgi:hypothetical protein